MLKLHYGIAGKTLIDIKRYFMNTYNPDWFNRDFTKRAILGIDKSEVVGPNLIISPVLGPISPDHLSDGVLGVILMVYDENQKDCDWIGEYFGDNCFPYILEASEIADHDIRMSVNHLISLPEKFKQPVYIENSNKIVYTNDDYFDDYIKTGLPILDNINYDDYE